uniref:RRM domain-containing protein n=1 Tax=Panagrellus redivivus TaxID=6233 RepID=A0A7E4V3K1_PANRE
METRGRDWGDIGEKDKSDKTERSSRRDRDRDEDRSSRRSRRRSRTPERRSRRSRTPERRRRSRSRDHDRRRRSRSPYERRNRRRSPPPTWRRTTRLPGPERRDVMYFQPANEMPEGCNPNMTPEERDERTVFILQLARDTRPTDLEKFFGAVGNVRDVRIITDSRTGRSKGIAYVEFWEKESVSLALGLNKQRLLGAPLIIQHSGAERNRQAAQTLGGALGFSSSFNSTGPMNLIVENLHPDINNKMLLEIFDPFGKVTLCEVVKDKDRNSLGFAKLAFRNAEDAKKVLEQMNGYEIAGKPLRIKVEEKEEPPRKASPEPTSNNDRLANDEKMELGHSGRLHVMAKLAEGSGLAIPQATRDAIAVQPSSAPPYATQCFMLSNMFDPATETGPNWDEDVADDVIIECTAFGGVLHVHVDKASPNGCVYVKCPTVLVAHNCVSALHGRYFAGKLIEASYVPATSYHDMFPASRLATAPLQPRRQ